MKPRRFKLLIESCILPKGSIAEYTVECDAVNPYRVTYKNKDICFLRPEQVEGRETFWQEITEPEKKGYAKSWEELTKAHGYVLNNTTITQVGINLNVHSDGRQKLNPLYKDVFATENQARSALAMAQLSQLLEEIYVGEGWRPDWKDNKQEKWCITSDGTMIAECGGVWPAHFLVLPTEELRDTFLENHKKLIEEYFLMYQH